MQVVITGLGLVTPAGLTLEDNWRKITHFLGMEYEKTSAYNKAFPKYRMRK